VNEWLKRLQAENYRGADAVLGWSFYSQGTKERATSAEIFLEWALDRLGINIETTSAIAKSEAIAEAIMKRRILLILDGCEPLQYGVENQQGELKDRGLRALLRRFAATAGLQTRGLVVLTSRLPIADIAHWNDSSAPVEWIEQLSDEAGAALLQDNSVWGTDKDLKAAVQDFSGHPLALGLLASFLKETRFGDIRRRDHIRRYFADPENPRHDHAKRVMESYEKEWLTDKPVLLAIMYIVGLFDRPANRKSLFALRMSPVIKGLTDSIINIDDKKWQRAVSRLRDVRLLSQRDVSAPNDLDAHPLVREWFGDRLKQKNEAVWKAAHARLFEHLRDTTKEGRKPTLTQLSPLFQAVSHGCNAGYYDQTFVQIFLARLCKSKFDGYPAAYASSQLGAFGSELAALSCFFDPPYEAIIEDLSFQFRSRLMNDVGICHYALGRFAEAVQALREAFDYAEGAEDWEGASVYARLIAAAELIIGEIDSAIKTISQAIMLNNKVSQVAKLLSPVSQYYAIGQRLTKGHALYLAGRNSEAEQLFLVERADSEFQSVQALSEEGSWYIDLLLQNGQWEAVGKLINSRILPPTALIEFVYKNFASARSALGLALSTRIPSKSSVSNVSFRMTECIEGLRNAAITEQIARGLLARNVLHRSVGDWEAVVRDLDEVEETRRLDQ
jgi:tetratricopeptide (TPR) repeat protein